MRGLLVLFPILAGILLGPWPARAEVAGLVGRWAAETPSGPIELQVEPAGRGTAVRLTRSGRALFDASFGPTDRPGVLEATATGLFAILGSRRAPANPLEGEELLWAREAGAALIVSRLAIDAGRPSIERAQLLRAGERVRLRLERLVGERMVVELEAELARTGR
ncbi:MAG: hypothetical protein K6T74_14425 [Geminicoccaceae bacterium]|nr:hypothetical protein [Geminicoccaceae bacterium]